MRGISAWFHSFKINGPTQEEKWLDACTQILFNAPRALPASLSPSHCHCAQHIAKFHWSPHIGPNSTAVPTNQGDSAQLCSGPHGHPGPAPPGRAEWSPQHTFNPVRSPPPFTVNPRQTESPHSFPLLWTVRPHPWLRPDYSRRPAPPGPLSQPRPVQCCQFSVSPAANCHKLSGFDRHNVLQIRGQKSKISLASWDGGMGRGPFCNSLGKTLSLYLSSF